MFGILVVIAILVLVVINYRIKRKERVVYRKRVAPPAAGYSIKDHPSVFAPHAFRTDNVRTNNSQAGSSPAETSLSDE